MKSLLSSAALAAAILCASSPAAAVPTLSFTPASSHINIGDQVVVDVSISGLGTDILASVDINFFFTGAAAQNIAGNFLSLVTALGPGGTGFFDPLTATEVGVKAHSVLDDGALAAVQPDSFSLGTFTFRGNSDGVTTIALGADPLLERHFVGRRGLPLNVDIGSACIAVGTGACVDTVPEPASFGLAGVALLAAGLAARRRRLPPVA